EELGKRDQALADYREVTRLLPNETWAYSRRAEIALKAGAVDEAVADYSEALRIEPDVPATHLALGRAYRRQGDLARALEQFKAAAGLPGSPAEAVYEVGLVHAERGEDDQAEEAFLREKEANPGYLKARAALALVRLKRGRVEEYRRECGEIAALLNETGLDEDSPGAVWVCCVGRGALAEPKVLAELAENAWAETKEAEAATALAAALLRAGAADKALARLKANLDRGEGGTFDRLLLALAHAQAGRRDEAAQWLTK